jgi:peptide chain release factor 2
VSTFDPDSLEQRLAKLEEQMNAPGFWGDQGRAAKLAAEHARVSRRLEGYRTLRRDYDDAAELAAMDGEMAEEIAHSLVPLRKELDRLQEAALFDGETLLPHPTGVDMVGTDPDMSVAVG